MIPVRGFERRSVAVYGLARSGLAAVRALVVGGADVLAWDDRAEAREAAEAAGARVADLREADWSKLAALVLSPGVPLTHPTPHWTVVKAAASGVDVIGDIELFARTVNAAPAHKKPKVVAITGTNGKSTTTALLSHLIRHARRDVRMGGNIGVGVLDLTDMHGGAIYVLECSSYQLDLTHSLRADVAMLLNVSPDHLERHGDMAGYVAAKQRVLMNQQEGDTAVIGVDDDWSGRVCTEVTSEGRRTVWPISSGRVLGRGVYALGGVLYDALGERVVEVADLNKAPALKGRHNWQNAAAAYAGARALGIAAHEAGEGLLLFPGLHHRMETVTTLGRVTFVNDSKATNADAARAAMAATPRFRWIAGGIAKAGGIEPLADLFPRVAHAYLIGEAAPAFARTLEGRAPYTLCDDLEHATAAAFADARDGGAEETVLLSPACASFDQYPDFEKRGDAFKAIVHALAAPRMESAA